MSEVLTYERTKAIAAIVLACEQFLEPGEKVIWRAPFRWMDRNGVLPNCYESFGVAGVCEQTGLELVHDYNHVAVVRPRELSHD
jgi:hypothetical protein